MSATALVIVVASLVLVGASVAAMAIGVMFRRPCLRGSCGGPALHDARGQSLACATCPNRARADTQASPAVRPARPGSPDPVDRPAEPQRKPSAGGRR